MRRRMYLASVGVLGLAGCLGSGEGSGDSTDASYGDWFDGVSNYDGETDLTSESAVTVAVGAVDGLVFGPAAIRIGTGTTVTWEWTGNGGQHNVVAEDDAFTSDYYVDEGATFEFTFDEPALHRYYCEPHRQLGMKGGVRVLSE